MSQLIPDWCVDQENVWSMAAVDATGFEKGHINPYFFKHSSQNRNPEKASEWRLKLPQTEVVDE
jgi:hypothetical protein